MVNGKVITLTDGTEVEVKLTMRTLYEIQHSRLEDGTRLSDAMKKAEEKTDEDGNIIPRTAEQDDIAMEGSAELMRIILLCAGRNVDIMTALDLMPLEEMDTIQDIFDEFEEKSEELKKKKAARIRMRMMPT